MHRHLSPRVPRGGCIVAALVLGALGCKDKASPPSSKSPSNQATAARDGGLAAKPRAPGKARKPPLLGREEVEALLARWRAAQNDGDFAAYSALYAATFRGVRRSGKKTVRLDHGGWLADRRRMFRRKMKVSIHKPELRLSPEAALISITQEFSSGSYHDVGPKILRVEKTDKGLKIVREEMLSSMLLRASADLPLASPQLLLVYRGRVVIADEADVDWGDGMPVLLEGEIVEQDPECETDPPDYEEEQDRYWECENTAPENRHDHFVATQAAANDEVPMPHREWVGRQVALYDARGKLACDSRLGGLRLRAEWHTTNAQAGADGGGTAREVADTILASGNPILVAELTPACAGALFARDAKLPPPPQWTLDPASPALAAAASAELREVFGFDALQAGASEVLDKPATPEIFELAPPGEGRRLVLATLEGPLSCQEDGFVAGLWEVTGSPAAPKLNTIR